MPRRHDRSKNLEASNARSLPSSNDVRHAQRGRDPSSYRHAKTSGAPLAFKTRDRNEQAFGPRKRPAGVKKPPFEGKATTHKERTDPFVRECLNDAVRGNDTQTPFEGDKHSAIVVFRFWLFHQRSFEDYSDMMRVYNILLRICARDNIKETKQACYALRSNFANMEQLLRVTGPGLVTASGVGEPKRFLHRIPFNRLAAAQTGFVRSRLPSYAESEAIITALIPKDGGGVRKLPKHAEGDTFKIGRKLFLFKDGKWELNLKEHIQRAETQINGMQGTVKGNAYVEARVEITEQLLGQVIINANAQKYVVCDGRTFKTTTNEVYVNSIRRSSRYLVKEYGDRDGVNAFREIMEMFMREEPYAGTQTIRGRFTVAFENHEFGVVSCTISYTRRNDNAITWVGKGNSRSRQQAQNFAAQDLYCIFMFRHHVVSDLNGANGEHTGSDDVDSVEKQIKDVDARINGDKTVGGRKTRAKLSRKEYSQLRALQYERYVLSVKHAVLIQNSMAEVSSKILGLDEGEERLALFKYLSAECHKLTSAHTWIKKCAETAFNDKKVRTADFEKAGMHINVKAYLQGHVLEKHEMKTEGENPFSALSDDEDDVNPDVSDVVDAFGGGEEESKEPEQQVVPTPEVAKVEVAVIAPPAPPIPKKAEPKIAVLPVKPVYKQIKVTVREDDCDGVVETPMTLKSMFKYGQLVFEESKAERGEPPVLTHEVPFNFHVNPVALEDIEEFNTDLQVLVSDFGDYGCKIGPRPFIGPINHFIGPVRPQPKDIKSNFGDSKPKIRSFKYHEGNVVLGDKVSKHHVVTNCDHVYYKGSVYVKRDFGYYTSGGSLLPDNVTVHVGTEYYAPADDAESDKYLLVGLRGGVQRRIIPAFQRLSAVVEARDFTWFKEMRVSLQEAWMTTMTVASLGSQSYRRTLYTHMSKTLEDMIICDFADTSLNEKLGAALTPVNQAQLLRKLAIEHMSVPIEILANTVLLHAQRRAVTQKRLNATLDGCNRFIADKNAYAEPLLLERVLLSYDDSHRMYCDEGPIQLTSEQESYDYHIKRKTCCVREKYVKADPSYSDVPNEFGRYYMFEPLTEKEGKKMERRGCNLSETGLKFRTMEEAHTTPYSTLGTIFATQSAIINHKDSSEYCKAAQRLLGTRDNEVIKRERSGVMEREVLRQLKTLFVSDHFDPDEELDALTEFIQRADPDYQGSEFNTHYCKENEIDLTSIGLTDDDRNFCYMRACVLYQHGKASLEHEGERLIDAQEHLRNYIKEIGAKVALRNGYVRDHEREIGESKTYLDVQMKPHEAQKYKKGKLKFGRMVVSVVGQGWIDANPTVMYDGKHMMEHPTIITPTDQGFRIEYMDVEQHYQYPCAKGRKLTQRFWMRSVLSDTSLDDLAAVVTEMEIQAQLGYAFINHGDDMLSAYFDVRLNKTVWCEGDIANNDSSHVDDCFRQMYLVDRFRKEDVVAAYAQCAYPVKFVNPMCPSEYGYFRSMHGMRLISGSVLTTYKNCAKSSTVGLSHAFYGGDFENAAAAIGMDVTTLVGELEDVTFLSKVMYRLSNDDIAVCTDAASILRKFGRVTGDVPGKSNVPVHKRIMEHQSGVIKGFVHEPNSAVIMALRERHVEDNTALGGIVRFLRSSARAANAFLAKDGSSILAKEQRVRSELNDHDYGLIRHYYGADEEDIRRGTEDYVRLVIMINETPAYGYTIFSKFVDAAMEKRYGMAATVIP